VNGPYGVPATPTGGAGVGLSVRSAGLPITICVASGDELIGGWALSVAVTEKANAPACVGVPDTAPSLPKMRPTGSVPLAFQV
jgi:hypothetical protein